MIVTKIDTYVELLATEGYRPRRDEGSTSITFKAEGARYRLQVPQEDPDYVRLLSFWRLPDDTTIEAALRVAGEINYERKAVKVAVVPDGRTVILSFEAFYKEPAHVAPFLVRVIELVDSAASEFFEQVRQRVYEPDAVIQRHTQLAE